MMKKNIKSITLTILELLIFSVFFNVSIDLSFNSLIFSEIFIIKAIVECLTFLSSVFFAYRFTTSQFIPLIPSILSIIMSAIFIYHAILSADPTVPNATKMLLETFLYSFHPLIFGFAITILLYIVRFIILKYKSGKIFNVLIK